MEPLQNKNAKTVGRATGNDGLWFEDQGNESGSCPKARDEAQRNAIAVVAGARPTTRPTRRCTARPILSALLCKARFFESTLLCRARFFAGTLLCRARFFAKHSSLQSTLLCARLFKTLLCTAAFAEHSLCTASLQSTLLCKEACSAKCSAKKRAKQRAQECALQRSVLCKEAWQRSVLCKEGNSRFFGLENGFRSTANTWSIRRKTSEFGGPGSTKDAGHKKRTFRSSPFSALFAPKTERRRCGDITGDKGFLAEIWLF